MDNLAGQWTYPPLSHSLPWWLKLASKEFWSKKQIFYDIPLRILLKRNNQICQANFVVYMLKWLDFLAKCKSFNFLIANFLNDEFLIKIELNSASL